MYAVEHGRRRGDSDEHGSFRIDNTDGEFVNYRTDRSNHNAVSHTYGIADADRPSGL